jgi:RecB family exonuclease
MKVYSFSRLTTWNTCKGGFHRKYNLNDKGEDNWFSRFGTLAHDIFEKVDRKEIPASQSLKEWAARYDEEVLLGAEAHEEPWMDNWLKDACRFFAEFKGWRTEAVWIEEHIEVESDYHFKGQYFPFKFQGYVDRLSRLPNGDFSMQDYKCSKPYKGTDLKEKQRQMYLYSAAVKERFGVFPKNLIFMHFRQNAPVIIPFKESDYLEAWEWAAKTVAEIETYEGDYQLTDNGYFCQSICNYRKDCPMGGA